MLRLVLLCGKKGVGKTTFLNIAKSLGIEGWDMSEVLREELSLESMREDEFIEKAKECRQRKGEDCVAKMVWKRIEGKDGLKVIVGLRSVEEYRFFLSKAKVLLVKVEMPEEKRIEILKRRGGLKVNGLEVEKKELKELGMDRLLSSAHVVVRNDGSKEEFEEKVSKLLEFLISEGT